MATGRELVMVNLHNLARSLCPDIWSKIILDVYVLKMRSTFKSVNPE